MGSGGARTPNRMAFQSVSQLMGAGLQEQSGLRVMLFPTDLASC